MERAKIALGLSKLSVTALIEFIRSVIDGITGNAYFTTPKPTLAALGTAANDLEEAQAKKKTLGLVNRNNKRNAARLLIAKEAMYVEEIADGDGAIIQSANMPLRKTPGPVSAPGQVRNVKLTDGNTVGQIYLTHKGAVGKGNNYFGQYSLDPNVAEKSWVELESTGKLKVLIKDLPSGRRIACRVRAKNTAGYGIYSAVAFRTIQ